jgi:hypothetical protein
MDQHSIVAYFALKGWSAMQIHNDLVETLNLNAVGYSTVTLYLRTPCFSSPPVPRPHEMPEPDLTESDKAILLALEEQPFASVRQLSRATHLPYSSVYRRLTTKLGFTVRHLRWVPHTLSEQDKRKRSEYSLQLLRILRSQRPRSWHDIVTLDESWFYFSTDYETIWLPAGASPPERERLSIKSKKMMMTVVWNPTGFIHLAALPKGAKFNADYYISNILTPVLDWRTAQRGATDRKLIVHADNARPHIANKVKKFFDDNELEMAPHPLYSPDLAPCDLYLFGYVKGQLKGQTFEQEEDLFRAVNTVCETIETDTLASVFRDWIERLEKCVRSRGEYVRDT